MLIFLLIHAKRRGCLTIEDYALLASFTEHLVGLAEPDALHCLIEMVTLQAKALRLEVGLSTC